MTKPDTAAPRDSEAEALHGKIAEALTPVTVPATRAASLRERLAARVAQSAARHRGLTTFRLDDVKWQNLGQGVRAHVLHDAGATRSALVEFAPGAHLPGHRHHAHEECVVLRGSLTAGNQRVGLHDYHLAPAGSKHQRIESKEGALAFLRGTSIGKSSDMLRELAGAWLPDGGAQPFTIAASAQGWRDIANGIAVKPLWQAGDTASFLLRLAAGARLPGHAHAIEAEYLMLAGEAFFGDLLLRTGEYQWAPKGLTHGDAHTDVGALVYVHGDSRDLQRE